MKQNITLIKNILGEDLYRTCYEFFQEMYERKSKFKIIMTRRCFSLYKIFKPILEADGIKNDYGTIITDKAVNLYLEEIIQSFKDLKSTKETVVTLFDDIIIYGRTVNLLLDDIFNTLYDETNEKNEVFSNNIVIRCMVQSNHTSKIKKDYKDRIIADIYGSRKDWRYISSQFSAIIKSSDIANTSYIISYKQSMSQDQIEKFYHKCLNTLIENTNEELTTFNVKYYIAQAVPKLEYNIFSEVIKTSWLRIYFYENLSTVQISPLVILKDLDKTQVDTLTQSLIETTSFENNSNLYTALMEKNECWFSSKIQLITLLLSHKLLCQFLINNKIIDSNNIDIENFDTNEIISFNFSPNLVTELQSITKEYLDFQNYDYQFLNKNETNINSTNIWELFEKVLFEKAMQDNQAATIGNTERTDVLSTINQKSVFSDEFMPVILAATDQGKAAIKTLYTKKSGLFQSLIYSGEQAFRIMNDSFKNILPYLSCLENYAKITEKNQYELYYSLITFFKNKNIETSDSLDKLESYLNILEKSKQEISDVYVPDSFMECKVDQTLLEEFIREGC